jgi:hypothetical protein
VAGQSAGASIRFTVVSVYNRCRRIIKTIRRHTRDVVSLVNIGGPRYNLRTGTNATEHRAGMRQASGLKSLLLRQSRIQFVTGCPDEHLHRTTPKEWQTLSAARPRRDHHVPLQA